MTDSSEFTSLAAKMLPDEVCSHRWARQVECADPIARVSHDLALAIDGQVGALGEDYPGF